MTQPTHLIVQGISTRAIDWLVALGLVLSYTAGLPFWLSSFIDPGGREPICQPIC